MLADEEAQLLRAERFEKKGMISKIERMSVEVSRDTARRELASAQTGARVAEAELMSALREKTLPELSTPLFVLTGNLGVLSEWQKKARLNAPPHVAPTEICASFRLEAPKCYSPVCLRGVHTLPRSLCKAVCRVLLFICALELLC